MNYIDLIVCILFVWALYNGWKQGAIAQVCSLAGILVGAWMGARYGEDVGEFLHLGKEYATIVGFLVVMIVVVVGATFVSRLVKKLFNFVGLGVVDIIVGVALSLCKMGIILSLLFGAFDNLNKSMKIISKESLEESKLYRPIIGLGDIIFPALDWTQKKIDGGID